MRALEAQVVIVGSGIAGSVLAAALARRGLSVAVIEQQKKVAERYRGEIIQPYAVEVLRAHGFLDGILGAGAVLVREFEDVCIHEGAALARRFPVQPSPNLPPDAVVLRHRLLMEAVRVPIRGVPGIELLEGVRVTRIARLADGRCQVHGQTPEGDEVTAAGFLLVGADGAQSVVRRSLPFVGTEDPLRHCFAGFVMRAPPGSFPFFTSIFPLGRGLVGFAFPVGHDEVRLCIAVDHEATRAAHDELEQMVISFQQTALGPIGYEVPGSPEIVEAFRIEPVFRIRTERAVLDGACVVGDAAGTVHPITGYGMTLALNDVVHLTRLLADAPPTAPVPASSLEAFESNRRRIRSRLEEVSDGYVQIFFETEDAPLRDAYWRWFTGQDAAPGHPVVSRFEEVSEEISRQFAEVAL